MTDGPSSPRCDFCGQTDGHSKRCSVVKFGVNPKPPYGPSVEIPPHCVRYGVYRVLRGWGFAWWTCVRIMWRGADLRVKPDA